ncbi:MAG: hypothetical protein N2322_05825 [Terrimicrobiaceae bacterium]|nr:hypothetical protein [Terrimicrobiaceae bacterium]
MAPLNIEWKRYRLPLRQELRMARGPVLSHREGVLIRVVFPDGQVGFGDAAPLPGWSKETVEDVLQALASKHHDAPLPSLQFALESARRAWAPQRPHKKIPLCSLALPGSPWPPPGAGTIKFKLPGGVGEALDLVAELKARGCPGSRLRFDANRQFSLDDALRVAKACEGLPVEFFEEPTFETAQLTGWPLRSPVPLAVDETLREFGPAHPACQAATVFVIKPTLTGGWEDCLRLASSAKAAVISSSFESFVGIHALGELAACLPGPPMAAGLDTLSWLSHGLIEDLPIQTGEFLAGEPLPSIAWHELAA